MNFVKSWPFTGSPSVVWHWMNIDSSYEHDVIPYYVQLKKQFIQQYQQVMKDVQVNMQEDYLSELINTINANPIGDQRQIALELIDDIADSVVERITISETKNLKEKYLARGKELKQKAKNIKERKVKELYKDAVQEIIEDDELKDEIQNTLKNKLNYKNEELSGFSTQETLLQLKFVAGLAYKGRLSRSNFSRTRMHHRRDTIAGYMREGLINKAFGDFMMKIGLSNENAIHTAAKKGNQNENEIDEFISFFDNVADSYNQVINTGEYYSNGELIGFGIQSKSFTVPWEQNEPKWGKTSFHIGYRSGLFDAMNSQWKYSRLKTIYYLSKINNAKQVIGPINVIFITGDHFYWTSTLLKTFKSYQYYLAFSNIHSPYKNTEEYIATKGTEWFQKY